MLGRRPAPVYELFSEDELLEPDATGAHADGDEDAGQADVEPGRASLAGGADRGEPRPAFAALDRAHTRADGRRVLATALVAAGLVGFSVWELLGLAERPQRRPAPGLAQLARLGGPQRPSVFTGARSAPPAPVRRSAVARVRARRGEAPRAAGHGASDRSTPQAGGSAFAGDGRRGAPIAGSLSRAATLTAPDGAVLADREFGFEQ